MGLVVVNSQFRLCITVEHYRALVSDYSLGHCKANEPDFDESWDEHDIC
jgi:hypothetical protein